MKWVICRFHSTKFITSPIFYVNSKPHIGHLYSATLADVFKRYYEFQGYKTMYSIGTDEHGLKIQQQAEKESIKPIELCNRVTLEFKRLFDTADVSFTDYIRTTEDRHKNTVHDIWNRLMNKGFIYKGFHEGWYSVSDECFVPEGQTYTEVIDGKETVFSKESGKVVEWTREENYKFRLNAFKPKLIQWLEQNPKAIIPTHAYRDVLNHLKSPDLGDISVSRLKSRVQWGIPVPNDLDHVIYVWLDALTNYLTVSGHPNENKGWPATVHVVGKDILKFHSIYWPAFLLAADLPLPKQILSHGHWLVQNKKMSKSSGNGVDPFVLMSHYGVDPIRYFLIRDGGIKIDPEFSTDTIWRRYKHDLAGQMGNLVMRCTSKKINPSGKIPCTPGGPLGQHELDIIEMIKAVRDDADTHAMNGNFDEYVVVVSNLVQELNRYWSLVQPWTFTSDTERIQNVLYMSFEGIRIAGLMLQPIMPNKMKVLLDGLGVPVNERMFSNAVLDGCTTERKVDTMSPLFPRIDELS